MGVLILFVLLLTSLSTSPAGALSKGDLAPSLRLPNLDGDTVQVTNSNEPMAAALLFWATWCTTCRNEIPAPRSVILAAQKRGIPVYAIAVESKVSDVRKFLEEKAPGLPVLVDSDGKATEKPFSLDFVPTLVMVDANGKVTRTSRL